MARYTQEQRDEALGALMASAVEQDGEWVPNYDATARALGMPATTLRRWWRGRAVGQDGELRRAVTRAREAAREDGAGAFLAELTAGYQRVARYIIDPIHYDTGTVTRPDGGEAVIRGARVDHAAKALQILMMLRHDLQVALGVETSSSSDPLRHAREAAQRTRLVATLEAGRGRAAG